MSEGKPGLPGERAAGSTGGRGGTGGHGGEPSGEGGQGGVGGAVYVDTEQIRAWVRRVWVAYFALAVAMVLGFYIGVREHDSRVKDNAAAIESNRAAIALIAKGTKADDREARASERADCERARAFRKLMIEQGLITDPVGLARLREFVRRGSRVGCALQ